MSGKIVKWRGLVKEEKQINCDYIPVSKTIIEINVPILSRVRAWCINSNIDNRNK